MATADTTNRLPSIAVIGSGYWGKNLVRNFFLLGTLKLICDSNQTILNNFRHDYPDVDGCNAFGDVLDRSDIDGVVIATPAETHYDLVQAALSAGKHVFVEKPLVLKESEGLELISIAKKKKRILMVGHLLQYHPIFMKLKRMCQHGELGRINYIYSNRLNLGKIRREENILWSFAPHDISMILSLAEDEPETVYATGGYYLHKKIADVTTTYLEFKSGLQAHIFVSWLHPFKEQKLVVVGDKKMAVFNDTEDWESKLVVYKHEIKWEHNIPIASKAEPKKIKVIQKEPLRQECEHFLHCIQTGATPITDGMEGLRVLRILNASQQSLDQKGIAVHPSQMRPEQEDQLDYFIHESAICEKGVKIGHACKIWHFSHILNDSVIGDKCNIGQNVVIGPDVRIGNGCKIQNNVSIYTGVTLENGVFCGPSMVFTNVYNPRAEIKKMDQVRPTLVKHGATLGANSTIVCGTTIGRYALIGAGALVNKDVPDHALVVGNPGKQIGWACTCGERLADDLSCLACDRCFEKTENGLKEKTGIHING